MLYTAHHAAHNSVFDVQVECSKDIDCRLHRLSSGGDAQTSDLSAIACDLQAADVFAGCEKHSAGWCGLIVIDGQHTMCTWGP